MTISTRLAALLVALGAPLPACDLDSDWPFDRACAASVVPMSLQGAWTVHGDGKRTSCDDATLNASELALTVGPLDIVQSGSTLTLAEPLSLPPGVSFTFDGARVDGSCVTFTTTETSAHGDVVRVTFDGTRDGSRLSGTFTGFGPGTCRLEGDFSVDVRR